MGVVRGKSGCITICVRARLNNAVDGAAVKSTKATGDERRAERGYLRTHYIILPEIFSHYERPTSVRRFTYVEIVAAFCTAVGRHKRQTLEH